MISQVNLNLKDVTVVAKSNSFQTILYLVSLLRAIRIDSYIMTQGGNSLVRLVVFNADAQKAKRALRIGTSKINMNEASAAFHFLYQDN